MPQEPTKDTHDGGDRTSLPQKMSQRQRQPKRECRLEESASHRRAGVVKASAFAGTTASVDHDVKGDDYMVFLTAHSTDTIFTPNVLSKAPGRFTIGLGGDVAMDDLVEVSWFVQPVN